MGDEEVISRRTEKTLISASEAPLIKAPAETSRSVEAVSLFTNENEWDVYVVAWIEIDVLNDKDKAVETSECAGSGVRPEGCALKAREFRRVPAAGSIDVSESVRGYAHHPRWRNGIGWKLHAGEYTPAFKYAFDPAAFRKGCDDECMDRNHHDDPAQPWNQALELTREFKGRLKVKQAAWLNGCP